MTRRCVTCGGSKLAHQLLLAEVEMGAFEASLCRRYRAPFWWRRLRGAR